MGLELVGGTTMRRETAPTAADSVGHIRDGIADAQSALAGVRARLQALLDRATELQKRLGTRPGPSTR